MLRPRTLATASADDDQALLRAGTGEGADVIVLDHGAVATTPDPVSEGATDLVVGDHCIVHLAEYALRRPSIMLPRTSAPRVRGMVAVSLANCMASGCSPGRRKSVRRLRSIVTFDPP